MTEVDPQAGIIAAGLLSAAIHRDMRAVAELINDCEWNLLADVCANLTGVAAEVTRKWATATGIDLQEFLTAFCLMNAEAAQ